jgi:Domain of unknown function (DUF4192)
MSLSSLSAGMTTTATYNAPNLQSPDHVMSALPFLLGFIPAASAVLLWMHHNTLVLTQRVDVPGVTITEKTSDELHEWAAQVAQASRHIHADQVLIALCMDGEITVKPQQRYSATLASALCRSIVDAGAYPIAIWLVDEDQWVEFDFATASFTGPSHVLDPQVVAEVADDFDCAGFAYRSARHELVEEVVGDRERQMTVLQALHDDPRLGLDLSNDHERDAMIDLFMNSCQGVCGDDVQAAPLLLALLDVQVRDCILWQLSAVQPNDQWAAHLRWLVRCAPPGLRAPVATISAIYAWMLGDGARANIALAQALGDDPEYALGRLLQVALTNAVPPSRWVAMMQGMTYESARGNVEPRSLDDTLG